MNKGRAYGIPGVGRAGDWPGGWTQTYAQVDTEAGGHGFDQNLFVQQVAGLSQVAGEFMLVKPLVIDLGWGQLKSALLKLPDASFARAGEAAPQRQMLVSQYIGVFEQVRAAAPGRARGALQNLAASISARMATEHQGPLMTLVEAQLAKLA